MLSSDVNDYDDKKRVVRGSGGSEGGGGGGGMYPALAFYALALGV